MPAYRFRNGHFGQWTSGVLSALSIFLIFYTSIQLEINGMLSTRLFRSSENSEATKGRNQVALREVAPFVFDSVYALLKQWPSTYAPNGHTVITATIPPNTPLYHAKSYTGSPKKPTFYAFDAEMSLGIFGSVGTPYLHTMVTTRPLLVVYFDGHSASPTGTGTMDAQTALLRGHVPLYPDDDFVYNETGRALELCDLARRWKVDGLVRMNAGFEVLVCDFTFSQLHEIHGVNITVPGNLEREQNPNLPKDPNRQPPLGIGNAFAEQNGWEWVRSGVWHYGNHLTGGGSLRERRIKLDFCGMANFYNPNIKSLNGKHQGGIRGNDTYQNGWGLRRGHRLLGIDVKDAQMVKEWIKIAAARARKATSSLFEPRAAKCSSTNWQVIVETITDQHKTRAIQIASVLNSTKNPADNVAGVIQKVHELSHAIIYPYLEYPTTTHKTLHEVKNETIQRCASVYTAHISPHSLGALEFLLKDSIGHVMEELCKWEWELFEWSEQHSTNLLESKEVSGKIQSCEIDYYLKRTASMLEWLGWNNWEDCEQKCGWDEICYIPMYPLIYSPGKHQGSIYAGSVLTEEELYQFWKPKCLNRAEFDRGGGRQRDPKHQLPDVPYNQSYYLG